ncbi:MAG: tRNA uridine-5-carboxymethylaminomethyl(34) synthesis enzyme MnmG [Acidobacteriota bacterium]
MRDVVVVGGGHAGIEAAAAAARLGASTTLVTFSREAIGRLSCNPAIGGIGKGHLACEIDALGGLMGRVADATGIQFRLLNTKRGRAVQGPRAQVDRELYPVRAQEELAAHPVEVVEDEVEALWWGETSDGRKRCLGVVLADHGELRAATTVLCTGTFLGGVLHVGNDQREGGRRGERAASALSRGLTEVGLRLQRFKTGTPPRLLDTSVDWDACEVQEGDAEPTFFSAVTRTVSQPQVPCHSLYTNERAHEIIREHLHASPLLAGRITGRGPRYCPSFEEKVLRFADRDRHQLILEPESLSSERVYVNGASTSLPGEAQEEFIRAIRGLEEAVILQHGYAVEYDHVVSGQVASSLEARSVERLFLAGQVLGTTGYEEAAGLGLLAGANAALKAQGREELVLSRREAYLGVMVDDLVIRGIDEPYRMFTSRAEHRLELGVDGVDLRLSERAAELGLVSAKAGRAAGERADRIAVARRWLEGTRVGGGRTLADECLRPDVPQADIEARLPAEAWAELGPEKLARDAVVMAADELRREPYVRRQLALQDRLARSRERVIPADFDFAGIPGLSSEIQERLSQARPTTLGQAGRLRGVTPAALEVLDAWLGRRTGS